MRNLTIKLIVLFACLLISACAKVSVTKSIPLDDAIFSYREALVTAQEEFFFEEFVKYKEFRHTFVLHIVSDIKIEATTNIKLATKGETKVALDELGLIKKIETISTQGGKITISLSPLGNKPEVYEKVKIIFDETTGLGVMYDLVYSEIEKSKKCEHALYCIPIAGLVNADGNQGFAYLKSIKEFRKLYDRIRKIKTVE